jgi:CheY-like chemotaxis protein
MPYTLLLADDSTTIQRIVELTFASEDIAVVAFSDGDHAIASLDRSIPDIVLADVGMPGRSGYEVSRYIKNSPPLAHIPVLLLTGAFEPVDQAKALEAGCDGILIKPFEPQFVISRVKELLKKSKPGSKDDEVEQYFEELDRAFANLNSTPPPPAPVDIEPPVAAPPRAALAVSSPAVSSPAVSSPAVSSAAVSSPAVSSRVPEAPMDASMAARPTLTEAFAALLAAERSPEGYKRPAPPPPQISTDELIELVTQRVLQQLSDTINREMVATIVQTTTERLVREEIERIKSNIK